MPKKPCKKCGAHCCNHVAIVIDTPTDANDFDNIRWYLLHEDVRVSISLDGDWLVEFKTPCRNITVDKRCADYKNRPNICKYYPGVNELCEGETDALPYTDLFCSVDDLDDYMKRRVGGAEALPVDR